MFNYFDAGQTKDDVKSMLTMADELIKTAESASEKLRRQADAARKDVQSERKALSSYEESACNKEHFLRAKDICEALHDCIMYNAVNMYREANSAMNFEDRFSTEDVPESHPGEEKNAHDFDVHVHIEDDKIYIKLPMLISVNRSRNHQKAVDKSNVLFREEIVRSIENAPEYDALDVRKFSEKTLNFLYVFSQKTSKKGHLIDNANHNTKYVIDAITAFLPGGDTPLTCSFFYSATVTDSVPEGTYITVARGIKTIIDNESVVRFWTSKMR